MLTFFTTAEPFRGHSWRIQRNALASWTLMHPAVEVILFGDEEGAAETARELGLRHEPYVERNEYGTKRLDYMFSTARALARHDILCYVNCDIILMEDFRRALERVKARHEQFLMLGRRWDAGTVRFHASELAISTSGDGIDAWRAADSGVDRLFCVQPRALWVQPAAIRLGPVAGLEGAGV